MALGQHLVRVLAAAIVMIVAHLAPSGAQAHPCHPHAPRAEAAAPERGVVSDLAAVVPPVAPRSSASGLYPDPTKVAGAGPHLTELPRSPSSAPYICNGLCCGLGLCCSALMLPEAPGLVPTRGGSRPVRLPDLRGSPGLDPEALPRPPRLLA